MKAGKFYALSGSPRELPLNRRESLLHLHSCFLKLLIKNSRRLRIAFRKCRIDAIGERRLSILAPAQPRMDSYERKEGYSHQRSIR